MLALKGSSRPSPRPGGHHVRSEHTTLGPAYPPRVGGVELPCGIGGYVRPESDGESSRPRPKVVATLSPGRDTAGAHRMVADERTYPDRCLATVQGNAGTGA